MQTFSQTVETAIATVRSVAPLDAGTMSRDVLRSYALGALWDNGALCPSEEHVARVVDAVRAELAAEEAAPVAAVGCGIPRIEVGARVRTRGRAFGSLFDRWGRRTLSRGVVVAGQSMSTGGETVSVRLDADGAVLPYLVYELEVETPTAEVAVSITGLRGSPERVAAELRQLAEKVESGWLGTSSASGCDVLVKLAGEPGSGPGGA